LIDDVQAAGRTPMQLKDAIQGRLSDFIEGPTVTVIVQSQVSKKYYLIGEVPGQGEYPLLKDMTIVQALAKASGFTEWADKDEILIFRRSNGQEKRIEVDYEEIVSGDEGAKNILLQAGDTIVVQ
jgi:polysaccharide export outer membrane protein